jgi:tRNA pseudouridine38-40 synthase
MKPLRRWKLLVAYDGTRFCGWQRQTGAKKPSVQQTLEEVLSKITGEKIHAEASGRTDAGVHAWGQVVSFACRRPSAPPALMRSLNMLLPGDVRVRRASRAPLAFHPRRDAVAKRYVYRVRDGGLMPPQERLYWACSPTRLDCASMSEAAKRWLGRHDFAAFRTAGSEEKSTVRTLRRLDIRRRGRRVMMIFEADAFMRHMARNMAGLLMAVGKGRMSAAGAAAVLASRDRQKAPAAAPPHGLTLEKVFYR